MSFRPNDTQHFKRIAKVRSRHMIPMEMLAFLTLLVAGWAGAFGPGYLHKILAQDDQALWWGLALMPVAGAGYAVSVIEWWIGGRGCRVLRMGLRCRHRHRALLERIRRKHQPGPNHDQGDGVEAIATLNNRNHAQL